MCVGPAKTLLNKLSCQVQSAEGKNDKFQAWQLFLDSTSQAELNPEPGLCRNSTEFHAGFKKPNFPNTYKITHIKMSMAYYQLSISKQTPSCSRHFTC